MKQGWDNREVAGRGTKFCWVVDNEDGTNPIRTYGWTEAEVVEKLGRTAGTAQRIISEQRTRLETKPPTAPNVPASHRAAVSPEETMRATADLANPAKAPAAIKTLLRAGGFDVDANAQRDGAHQAARLAQEWAARNPEFPNDPRNQRALMDRALMYAGSKLANITREHFDQAFEYLISNDMLYPVADPEPTPAHASGGSPDSRGEGHRSATSYRRTALSTASQTTTAAQPKPKYTREQIDNMDTKTLEYKIRNEPGFLDVVNQLATSTKRQATA